MGAYEPPILGSKRPSSPECHHGQAEQNKFGFLGELVQVIVRAAYAPQEIIDGQQLTFVTDGMVSIWAGF